MTVFDKNLLTLILQSGVFAKGILLVLLTLSIIAWTITLFKTQEFSSLLRNFRKIFGRSSQNEGTVDLRELFSKNRKTPISRIYQDGERVLKTAVSLSRQTIGEVGKEQRRLPQVDAETDSLFASELKQRLENAVEEEASQLAWGLSFMGTVITVSPFLGLLGTVWGVMHAFLNIGASGSADLSTVAPGIAEALITTIAGLAVAIPAVFCYNHLNARLRRVEDSLYRLSGELTIYFSQKWFHEKTKIKSTLGN